MRCRMSKLTTRQKILNHLNSGRTLDNIKAWELYKTMSLQQHIHALRNQGIEIHTLEKVNKKTGVRFAEYSIATF